MVASLESLGGVGCQGFLTAIEEAGMTGEERRALDAVGLLRALAEQAMHEEGLTGVRGQQPRP